MVPPAAWTSAMCSALATWREPWNMTCSKRWANPVLPGTSCFEPTLYQMLTAATGARWSSEMISRRPLARRSSVKLMLGALMAALAARGLPVPRPMADLDGAFASTLDGYDVQVLEYIAGRTLEDESDW